MKRLGLFVIIMLFFPFVAFAQTTIADTMKMVPSGKQQIDLSFAPLVKKAKPAVVNIYAQQVVQQRLNPFFSDDFFSGFFGNRAFGTLAPRVQNSLGSGVIISDDGMIITNAHVAADSIDIMVVLSDRREYKAETLYVDNRADLAVLKIDAGDEKLPFVPLGNSSMIEVGDLVLAIGNPFGVGQTVTSGIISATARTVDNGRGDMSYFIQTDAAINPGNSGGALLNMKGELIGVNASIYSQNGSFVGIGFAIPSNLVRTAIVAAQNDGKPQRPWFGAVTQSLTADIAETMGIKIPSGALVRTVTAKSPAEKSGLKTGDVILSVNGQSIFDEYALAYYIATVGLGEKANIRYLRDGRTIETWFTGELPPENPPREEALLGGNNPLSGVTVVNISPAVIEEMGIDLPEAGVVIEKIDRRSVANRMGMAVGDVLHSINGSYVTSVEDVKKVLTENDGRGSWRVQLKRGNQMISTMIGG